MDWKIIPKKVSAGLSYTIDDKNRFVVATGYDASDQLRLRDLDYYWYHDLALCRN